MTTPHESTADELVKQLNELYAAATPGPWDLMAGMPTNVIGASGVRVARCDFDGDMDHLEARANADLISAFFNAFPQLAATIERQAAEIKQLQETLKLVREARDQYLDLLSSEQAALTPEAHK